MEKKIVGYKEDIRVTIGSHSFDFEATLDTGNGSSASTLGCELVEELTDDTIRAIIRGLEFRFEKYGESHPKVGQVKERRVIALVDSILVCGHELKQVPFSLVDNRNKSTDVLLNRDVLTQFGFIIDPSRKFTRSE